MGTVNSFLSKLFSLSPKAVFSFLFLISLFRFIHLRFSIDEISSKERHRAWDGSISS